MACCKFSSFWVDTNQDTSVFVLSFEGFLQAVAGGVGIGFFQIFLVLNQLLLDKRHEFFVKPVIVFCQLKHFVGFFVLETTQLLVADFKFLIIQRL